MKISVHISCSLQQIMCSLLNVLKILMKTYIMYQLPANILLSIFTRSSSIVANKNSKASPMAQKVKNPSAMQEAWVQSLGWKDPLEEVMATHSSTPAWRILWTEVPSRLQSRGRKKSDTTEHTHTQ